MCNFLKLNYLEHYICKRINQPTYDQRNERGGNPDSRHGSKHDRHGSKHDRHGNAAAEQAAPTTQTSSKPQAQATSAATTAAQPQPTAATNAAQQRTATTPPPLPTQQPETADSLKAQLTALQARLDAIETQRTTEARTAEIERIIAPQ